MITDDDYQTALKALKLAAQKPDQFATDDIEEMTKIVEGYKSQGRSASSEPFGPPTAEQAATKEKQAAEKERVKTEHPEIVAALEASGLPYGLPLPEARKARFAREVEDKNLPSASGRRDENYRPPEYTGPNSLGYGPDIGSYEENRSPGIGSAIGGKTIVFDEPSVNEFRQTMRPVYGDKVDAWDKTSPEYRAFADKKYMQAYDAAEKAKTSIVRAEYVPNDQLRERLKRAQAAGGALVGAADAATAGLASKLVADTPEEHRRLKELEDTAPTAATLPAQLAGSMLNPFFRMIPGGAPGQSFAKGVAKTALGSGAASAATTATELAASEDKVPLAEAAKRVGLSGLLGTGAGTIGGVVSEAARLHGENLNETTALGELRRRGAETSMVHGIEAGPTLAAEEAAAKEAGYIDPVTRRGDVQAWKAAEAEAPATTAARREQGLARQAAEETKKQVYNRLENNVEISTEPLVDKLRSVRRDLVRTVEEIDPDTGEKIVRRVPLSPVAQRQASAIDSFLRPITDEGGHPVGLTAKQIDKVIEDLQSFDPKAVASGAEGAANVPLPRADYDAIKESAHQMRDQVMGAGAAEGASSELVSPTGERTPLHEYSAYEHETSKEMSAAARRRYAAGLPEGEVPEKLSGPQGDRFQGTARDYGRGGERDRALERYAGKESLEPIRSANQLEDLRKHAGTDWRLRMYGPIPVPITSMTGIGARLRIDPALRQVQRFGYLPATAAPVAEPRLRRQNPENQLSIDQISAILANMPQ